MSAGRTVRVACRCVEVDHAIERAAATDPLVDGLALLLLIRVIVILKLHTFESALERRRRGADDAASRGHGRARSTACSHR